MDKLWAPWRIKYITGRKSKKCVFCAQDKNRAKGCVIFKTKYSVCLMNIFPYNNGHLMAAPLRHTKDLNSLRQEEIIDLFACLNKAKSLLDKVMKPDGYNIGINISRAAGAGITGHLHIHIVPRWVGDTNFMPVIHNTKIISESLHELYKRLKNAESKTNKRV